jgi:4-amino-4-deoxy-L-arabinose transferase-like glycosyltransferase
VLLAIQYTALHVVQHPSVKLPWTTLERQEWAAQNAVVEKQHPELVGGGFEGAAAYTPFYYLLETPAYALGKSSDPFTRLWLMRLTSAVLAGAAAIFAFLFVSELLGGRLWAATLGGLAVALEPMFSQMGGAVNNDILVILLGSAELWLLARILRRGPTVARAVGAGAVLGLGILAKPNMYAFVPVAVAVIAWALLRTRASLRLGLKVASAAFVPLLVLTAVNVSVFAGGGGLSGATTISGSTAAAFNLREFLSYTWQWYLPRLPFMHNFNPLPEGSFAIPAYDIFFKGFWADFGSLDAVFPDWVYGVLLVASIGIVSLLLWGAFRSRRRPNVIAAGILLGVLPILATAALVNLRSYLAWLEGQPFAQGRYLLQGVAVLGAAVAAAALSLGERRGRIFGAVMIVSLAALNAFSLGLVLLRYYG